MVPDIPEVVQNIIAGLRNKYPHYDVYIVGGALCDRPTQDYDLVILTDCGSPEALKACEATYVEGLFNSIEVYEAYESDDKFHTKAVTYINNIKVDLLFADSKDYTIEGIVDNFPLSVQMRYWKPGWDFTISGDKFCREPVIIYKDVPECIAKYKGYYPERTFIDAT